MIALVETLALTIYRVKPVVPPSPGSGSVRYRSLTSLEMTRRLFCCHFERSEKSLSG